jgi:uncharacterized membrane protein (UPF0136 family)
MNLAAITAILYGILVGVGGTMGYVNKGSKASLISGVACAVVLIGCGLVMRGGNAGGARAAWWVAVVVTLAVLGRFGPAFLRTGDWMPAGTTALLSIAALIGLIAGRK